MLRTNLRDFASNSCESCFAAKAEFIKGVTKISIFTNVCELSDFSGTGLALCCETSKNLLKEARRY